jgi:hypothetical protein
MDVRLEMFGTEDAGGWLGALQRCGNHDFFHLPEFHRMAERRGQGEARLYVVQGGGRCMALPLLLRPVEGRFIGESAALIGGGALSGDGRDGDEGLRDALSVSGYPGPVGFAGEDAGEKAGFVSASQRLLESQFRADGVVAAFSLLNPLLEQQEWLKGMGEIRWVGETVAMDLALSEEEQWRRIRSTHRRQILRLIDRGVSCEEVDPGLGLDEFVKAYSETMERVGAQRAYRYETAFFEELFTELGGAAHLWLARLGGEPIAGAIFVECTQFVQYYLSGTRDAWVGLSPMKLILDTVRRWASARGRRYLHLGGGVGRRDSLFDFKAGFSELYLQMGCWRWVGDAGRYEQICRRAVERWEAQGLEPEREDFFPAYRSPLRERKVGEKVKI